MGMDVVGQSSSKSIKLYIQNEHEGLYVGFLAYSVDG